MNPFEVSALHTECNQNLYRKFNEKRTTRILHEKVSKME